ncbi:winged helix-turn-helix domain-containing protein [Burkholderia sp. PU8-34]
MAEGKMGPLSRKIIECVQTQPGIHAGEVTRTLKLSSGGSTREIIRRLISRGYLAAGTKRILKGCVITPLTYTGKSFEGTDDWALSGRWQKHQEKVAAQIAYQEQAGAAIASVSKAIRAMIDVGRVAA